MHRVLSTKKLSPQEKKRLRDAKIEVVDYDALRIDPVPFKMPEYVENAIFTSKNAAQAVIKNSADAKKIKNSFCVGSKTGKILSENGLKPLKIGDNATDLGQFILRNYPDKDFYFFCGDKRREELPSLFKAQNTTLIEIKTYRTILTEKKNNADFDLILFFSPSGIESFVKNNDLRHKTAVCIGKTTAFEAKKHTEKVEIAVETTVESVIEKAIELIEKKN